MSYDLCAEGLVDFFDVSVAARELVCADVFPLRGEGPRGIGIAVLSKRVGIDGAREQFREFLTSLQVMGATIHDLHKGCGITSEADVDELFERIFDGV